MQSALQFRIFLVPKSINRSRRLTMPAPDFKKLHKEWKKAKSDAKLLYDGWVKQNTDLSNAHVEVKNDLPAFPKFKLNLGPSLENIEKKKDLEKSKTKAEKAVTQYEKDIKSLVKDVGKVPTDKDAKKMKVQSTLVKYLRELLDVRDEIEKALKTI